MTVTEQRAAALHTGNQIRFRAAAVKRDLHDGRITLHEALHHPDGGIVRVDVLLRCLRGVGPSRVGRVLRGHCISEGRRVRDLTDRQRVVLAVDGRLATRYYDREAADAA